MGDERKVVEASEGASPHWRIVPRWKPSPAVEEMEFVIEQSALDYTDSWTRVHVAVSEAAALRYIQWAESPAARPKYFRVIQGG